MAVTQRLMTAEELWDMPDIPGKQRELVRGELIEAPTPGAIHNVIADLIRHLLRIFVTERQLGIVFGDNMGYILHRGPDTVRIPDVSFVAWEHIPETGIPEGSWLIPPDLVVEVVSSNDHANDVYDKAREYVESGVRIVWVLWPKRRAASVHTRDEKTAELGPDDILDGGEVLHGFTVRVGDLFEMPTRPERPA